MAIADVLFRRLLTADRFANLLVPLAIGPLFFTTFGSFKRLIPVINPYGWDETFMRVDQALHGGWHPWELIQPLVGSPLATSAINFAYNLWLPLMFLTFIWQSWSLRRPALRRRYLISFLLFWIAIGTVLATLLSSAGPCYYGRVTGLEDPYAPLMAYLYAADGQASVWSLKVQEMLWRNYVDGGTLLGSGISAMPSMHVAIAVLMALMAMRIHRWLGAAYWVFAAVIVVGSVHLGWHYAVDAYVSALAGIAIWFGVGKILRARETSAGRQPALLEGTSGR